MIKKVWRYYVPLLGVMLIVVFLWRGLSLNPRELPSALLDKSAPAFRLPSLLKPDQYLDQRVFKGSVTLLNVWASWCDTCSEEQAFLMTLKVRYPRLTIIGLDFQDKPDKARVWLHEHGNPYTIVLNDESGAVGVDYGVYGTPESFLIDERGVIRAKVTGVLTEQTWQKMALLLSGK